MKYRHESIKLSSKYFKQTCKVFVGLVKFKIKLRLSSNDISKLFYNISMYMYYKLELRLSSNLFIWVILELKWWANKRANNLNRNKTNLSELDPGQQSPQITINSRTILLFWWNSLGQEASLNLLPRK